MFDIPSARLPPSPGSERRSRPTLIRSRQRSPSCRNGCRRRPSELERHADSSAPEAKAAQRKIHAIRIAVVQRTEVTQVASDADIAAEEHHAAPHVHSQVL